jgi:ketosteroid isomerase-like protein
MGTGKWQPGTACPRWSWLRAILPVGLLLGASCEPAPESEAETAVRRARLEQTAALADRDIDRAATYWADDVVVTSGLGLAFTGAASYRRAFELDSGLVYERFPDRVQASSAWPLVWEDGLWSGRRVIGPSHPVIRGRYSAMWARIDGRWRIRSELFVAVDCTDAACRWPVALR